MTALTLKLAQLRFGHDPLAGPEINARQSGRLEGVEEMAAMLSSQGQLVRLIAVLNPTKSSAGEGLYFVADGNRRLAAMQKHWKADAMVLVEVVDSAANALEMSIAANTGLPLHPVDRYRAYAEVMKRDKIDAAQLARRFGVTTKDMQKSLALSALCDEVLDAWLADIITADEAAVFTLAPDKKEQARILAAAQKKGDWALEADDLRDAIIGKRKDVSDLINFVGVDAYRKAGGKLQEDLFASKHIAHDPGIAVKLAKQKAKGICDDLKKAGWSWVEIDDDMPAHWLHSMDFTKLTAPAMPPLTPEEQKARLALVDVVDAASDDAEEKENLDAFDSVVRARAFGAAAKAKSGCVVALTSKGALRIYAGIVKPAQRKAAEAAKKKAEPASKKKAEPVKPAQIPSALASDLSMGLTRAVSQTILDAKDPMLVARLLTVGFATPGGREIGIQYSGLGSDEISGADHDQPLQKQFDKTGKFNVEDMLLGPLARYLAASITLTNHSPDHQLVSTGKNDYVEPDVEAIVHIMPADLLQKRLVEQFDADAYFDRAPAAFAKGALDDMGRSYGAIVKKAALAKLAAACAKEYSWLPVQLRTKDYAGPKSMPAKKKAAKK